MPPARNSSTAGSLAYDEDLKANGNLVVAEALQPAESAVLVRVRNRNVSTTDEPFIEKTKEQVAGFILIEARDLNDAIHIAWGTCSPKSAANIEVRAVADFSGAMSVTQPQIEGASKGRVPPGASHTHPSCQRFQPGRGGG